MSNWRHVKGPNHNAAFYTDKQRSSALEMRNKGATINEITFMIGCDTTTVYRWFRQHRSGEVPISPAPDRQSSQPTSETHDRDRSAL